VFCFAGLVEHGDDEAEQGLEEKKLGSWKALSGEL
jgi:hypothetical protein